MSDEKTPGLRQPLLANGANGEGDADSLNNPLHLKRWKRFERWISEKKWWKSLGRLSQKPWWHTVERVLYILVAIGAAVTLVFGLYGLGITYGGIAQSKALLSLGLLSNGFFALFLTTAGIALIALLAMRYSRTFPLGFVLSMLAVGLTVGMIIAGTPLVFTVPVAIVTAFTIVANIFWKVLHPKARVLSENPLKDIFAKESIVDEALEMIRDIKRYNLSASARKARDSRLKKYAKQIYNLINERGEWKEAFLSYHNDERAQDEKALHDILVQLNNDDNLLTDKEISIIEKTCLNLKASTVNPDFHPSQGWKTTTALFIFGTLFFLAFITPFILLLQGIIVFSLAPQILWPVSALSGILSWVLFKKGLSHTSSGPHGEFAIYFGLAALAFFMIALAPYLSVFSINPALIVFSSWPLITGSILLIPFVFFLANSLKLKNSYDQHIESRLTEKVLKVFKLITMVALPLGITYLFFGAVFQFPLPWFFESTAKSISSYALSVAREIIPSLSPAVFYELMSYIVVGFAIVGLTIALLSFLDVRKPSINKKIKDEKPDVVKSIKPTGVKGFFKNLYKKDVYASLEGREGNDKTIVLEFTDHRGEEIKLEIQENEWNTFFNLRSQQVQGNGESKKRAFDMLCEMFEGQGTRLEASDNKQILEFVGQKYTIAMKGSIPLMKLFWALLRVGFVVGIALYIGFTSDLFIGKAVASLFPLVGALVISAPFSTVFAGKFSILGGLGKTANENLGTQPIYGENRFWRYLGREILVLGIMLAASGSAYGIMYPFLDPASLLMIADAVVLIFGTPIVIIMLYRQFKIAEQARDLELKGMIELEEISTTVGLNTSTSTTSGFTNTNTESTDDKLRGSYGPPAYTESTGETEQKTGTSTNQRDSFTPDKALQPLSSQSNDNLDTASNQSYPHPQALTAAAEAPRPSSFSMNAPPTPVGRAPAVDPLETNQVDLLSPAIEGQICDLLKVKDTMQQLDFSALAKRFTALTVPEQGETVNLNQNKLAVQQLYSDCLAQNELRMAFRVLISCINFERKKTPEEPITQERMRILLITEHRDNKGLNLRQIINNERSFSEVLKLFALQPAAKEEEEEKEEKDYDANDVRLTTGGTVETTASNSSSATLIGTEAKSAQPIQKIIKLSSLEDKVAAICDSVFPVTIKQKQLPSELSSVPEIVSSTLSPHLTFERLDQGNLEVQKAYQSTLEDNYKLLSRAVRILICCVTEKQLKKQAQGDSSFLREEDLPILQQKNKKEQDLRKLIGEDKYALLLQLLAIQPANKLEATPAANPKKVKVIKSPRNLLGSRSTLEKKQSVLESKEEENLEFNIPVSYGEGPLGQSIDGQWKVTLKPITYTTVGDADYDMRRQMENLLRGGGAAVSGTLNGTDPEVIRFFDMAMKYKHYQTATHVLTCYVLYLKGGADNVSGGPVYEEQIKSLLNREVDGRTLKQAYADWVKCEAIPEKPIPKKEPPKPDETILAPYRKYLGEGNVKKAKTTIETYASAFAKYDHDKRTVKSVNPPKEMLDITNVNVKAFFKEALEPDKKGKVHWEVLQPILSYIVIFWHSRGISVVQEEYMKALFLEVKNSQGKNIYALAKDAQFDFKEFIKKAGIVPAEKDLSQPVVSSTFSYTRSSFDPADSVGSSSSSSSIPPATPSSSGGFSFSEADGSKVIQGGNGDRSSSSSQVLSQDHSSAIKEPLENLSESKDASEQKSQVAELKSEENQKEQELIALCNKILPPNTVEPTAQLKARYEQINNQIEALFSPDAAISNHHDSMVSLYKEALGDRYLLPLAVKILKLVIEAKKFAGQTILYQQDLDTFLNAKNDKGQNLVSLVLNKDGVNLCNLLGIQVGLSSQFTLGASSPARNPNALYGGMGFAQQNAISSEAKSSISPTEPGQSAAEPSSQNKDSCNLM